MFHKAVRVFSSKSLGWVLLGLQIFTPPLQERIPTCSSSRISYCNFVKDERCCSQNGVGRERREKDCNLWVKEAPLQGRAKASWAKSLLCSCPFVVDSWGCYQRPAPRLASEKQEWNSVLLSWDFPFYLAFPPLPAFWVPSPTLFQESHFLCTHPSVSLVIWLLTRWGDSRESREKNVRSGYLCHCLHIGAEAASLASSFLSGFICCAHHFLPSYPFTDHRLKLPAHLECASQPSMDDFRSGHTFKQFFCFIFPNDSFRMDNC